MQVDFQILADGEDVTEVFRDRLISISIVDEAGMKSDKATIALDDRDYGIELPETGALLEISLGFVETGLVEMGKYTVDEVSGEGPTDQLKIMAKAADMLKGIKAPKTRNWDQVTLKDIVGKIAGEHGLEPAVGESLKGHYYAYLAQTSESDLHFLTRLAKELDATTKPDSGSLVFVTRGDGKTAEGEEIEPIAFGRSDLSRWSWKIGERKKYKKIVAEWSEPDQAKVNKVTLGKGEPELKMRHRYATKAEATRAAEGAINKSSRNATLSVEPAGFYPDLCAEGVVEIDGIKPELAGKWSVTHVEHLLQKTLTTSFDAERDHET